MSGVFADWHAEVMGTLDHGETVVAETWQVTRFRDGNMSGFTAYGNRAAALEAAGLA